MEGQISLMRRPSLFVGAVLGGLTSLPLIALSYLGQQAAGLPFVPFDLFDWLARVLPGSVITVGIDTMVRFITLLGLGPIGGAAKRIEQFLGILLVIAGSVVLGFIMALIIRSSNWTGRNVGAVIGFVAFLSLAAIEINLRTSIAGNPVTALLWLALLTVGWGALLGTWLTAGDLLGAPSSTTEEYRAARRALLIKLAGGSIGIAVAAWGIGRLLEAPGPATGAGQALSRLETTTPPATGTAVSKATSTPLVTETTAATLRERIPPAPGTRPDLTPNKDFYRVDIDTRPPAVQEQSWVLQIAGLFDRPRPLTLSDLLDYPAVTQPITLCCISNPIGGDLISTSNWTGVRLRDLLKDLGLRPEAEELYIKSVDGFYESVVMEDMMDPRTLLVYGMNGDALPQAHGFPLRIYIPNRYGMKQPKWITSIEAIDHKASGYWEDRGWSAEARPQILSIIDTVAKDFVENGQVPVGGIAWAGDRGIQKVQVQVDNGVWAETVLRTPSLGPLTWVQWRYDWPAVGGRHTFRVRATDGTGALQIEERHDPYPDGATGYESVTVTI
jgi:DMSO/TMAO reductase YedYZ molybdopterin-dependent catalytic subunit